MVSRAKKSVTRRTTGAKSTVAKSSAPAAKASPRSSARRPLRSLVIFSMVGGLVATVGLPAYGAITLPSDEPQTLQQVAAEDAQSLVIASDAGASEEPVDLGRESYSATTAEEIEKKKAEEAAAEAAAERARLAAAAASSAETSQTSYSVDLSMVAPGIAEALIATAMGLFAAIPAVVAYNFFSNKVDFIENRFQTFMEEMSGIVERGMNAASPATRTASEKPRPAANPEPVRTPPEL